MLVITRGADYHNPQETTRQEVEQQNEKEKIYGIGRTGTDLIRALPLQAPNCSLSCLISSLPHFNTSAANSSLYSQNQLSYIRGRGYW